jgi:hypothetical protein
MVNLRIMRGCKLLRPGAATEGLCLERILAPFVLSSLLSFSGSASAATLAGRFDIPGGGTYSLSEEGTLDWGYWGLVDEWSYNHKYGVAQQITYSFITVTDYAGWPGPYIIPYSERLGGTIPFSWTDGTPSRVIDAAADGVSIYGDKTYLGNIAPGFHIECPADTSLKTLKLYVGNSWGPSSLTASLSGSAGLTYYDTSLDGHKVVGNGVYTLNFQADAPGQTLTVEFTSIDSWWYNTLQAATLAGTNSPPTVAIATPTDGARFSAPATFSLSATAADSGGAVTNLTLLKGATVVGQSASGALSVTLANQPAGAYNFLAVATDSGGITSTSFPVRVFVTTNGGTLIGSVVAAPGSADLSAEGTTDWAHWGLNSPSGFDHKAGVVQQIPNVVPLNASLADLNNDPDILSAYSWSDGTPTAQAYSSTGNFLFVTNNPLAGYQLTVPATNRLRRLKVYLGLLDAQGTLDARLSDFSAMPYSDTSLVQPDDIAYGVYTLTFASANPGANLIVTWTAGLVLNPFYSELKWEAATLEEAPALAAIPNRTINVGTTLTITNTVGASPHGPLTFSLGTGAVANAAITSDTGVFTWTPTAAQTGTSTFSIVVTDSGSPPLSTTQTFSVTVVGSNSPPVLAAVTNRTIAVGMTLTITNIATDPDRPAQTLTFSLGSGATANASLNATTGVFTWAPTTAQIGTNAFSIVVTDSGSPPLSATQTFKVTVVASNNPPVLAAVSNRTIAVGMTLTITNVATDSDLPAQALTFNLGSGAAANASLNATTGVFTWAPTTAQVGTNAFNIVVTDSGLPPLSTTQTFKVTVMASNTPPALAAVSSRTIAVGMTLTITNVATDSDLPAQALTFSLGNGGAANASLNATTGVFTWSPTTAQVGTNAFSVVVTDSGLPPLSATQTFKVTVMASNTPPVLAAVSSRTATVGIMLSITNVATDSDLPAQTLTYSLGSGGAANASLNATTGVFTWTPATAQVGTNAFSIVVTDSGLPPLSTTQTFKVTVVASNSVPSPVLAIASSSGAQPGGVSFGTVAGVNYTVQFTNDLRRALGSTNWPTLTNIVGNGAVMLVPDSGSADVRRFYRVLAH